MKPVPFNYLCAYSLEEALHHLHGNENAKVIAGGQSLMPMLNFRVVQPSLLVDISKLVELDYIKEVNGRIVIGALTRHTIVGSSELVKEHLPVNVQEAIIQLNLPEERSTSPSVEKNFFRPEEEAPVNPSVMPLRRAKSLYPFFSDRHQEPVFRDRGAMSVPAQEHQNSML